MPEMRQNPNHIVFKQNLTKCPSSIDILLLFPLSGFTEPKTGINPAEAGEKSFPTAALPFRIPRKPADRTRENDRDANDNIRALLPFLLIQTDKRTIFVPTGCQRHPVRHSTLP